MGSILLLSARRKEHVRGGNARKTTQKKVIQKDRFQLQHSYAERLKRMFATVQQSSLLLSKTTEAQRLCRDKIVHNCRYSGDEE
jgi:hypothetical protein